MDAIKTCPTCDQTIKDKDAMSVASEEHYEPTFTEGKVRKFPKVLLNGMREQDVNGKWWYATDNSWFPYGDDDGESVACEECWGRCEDGKVFVCEKCEKTYCEDCDMKGGEKLCKECDDDHECECCQEAANYDDLYKCDDCLNLYCDDCGSGKGGQCVDCKESSDDDE